MEGCRPSGTSMNNIPKKKNLNLQLVTSLTEERKKPRTRHSLRNILMSRSAEQVCVPEGAAVFHTFSRGSLTVEAAWALPLFFLCMSVMICLTDIYGTLAKRTVELQQQAEAAGSAAGAAGAEVLDVIDLRDTVVFRPEWLPFHAGTVRAACRGRVRSWIGRPTAGAAELVDENEEELVYVTDYESVYHTDSHCTHLDLTIRGVKSSAVGRCRNDYGKRYHACEKCCGGGRMAGTVYITPEGDRYHNSSTCSGLTRTTRLVPRSEVSAHRQCSRCAQKKAA